jgi:hypothetical protein
MIWVRERTIPIERPPPVNKVIAIFLRIEGVTWSAWRIPTAVFSFSRQEPLLFHQVAPQLYSRGWVDPVPDPLLLRKSDIARNRTWTSGSVDRNWAVLSKMNSRVYWKLSYKCSRHIQELPIVLIHLSLVNHFFFVCTSWKCDKRLES